MSAPVDEMFDLDIRIGQPTTFEMPEAGTGGATGTNLCDESHCSVTCSIACCNRSQSCP